MKSQRLSNFKPRFTDEELVTVYLFGHLNGLFQKKAIYRFLRNYWADWFPRLPSYQAFSNRLNLLESSFQIISRQLLESFSEAQTEEADHLINSFPIILAKGAFARRARVAREFAAVGLLCRQACSFSWSSPSSACSQTRRSLTDSLCALVSSGKHSRFDGFQRKRAEFTEYFCFRR